MSDKEIEERRLASADAFFAQGARCGHIEGKGRAESYVIQEEYALAYEASRNQSFTRFSQVNQFEAGYRHGYCKAAEGSPLEEVLMNWPLPDTLA